MIEDIINNIKINLKPLSINIICLFIMLYTNTMMIIINKKTSINLSAGIEGKILLLGDRAIRAITLKINLLILITN